MTRTRRTSSLLAVGLAVILVLAACGGGDGDDDDPAAAPAAPDDSSTVTTAEADLGKILVDADGNTLYAFTPDSKGPSTCIAACLEAWPALEGPATADGDTDPALFGTATRPDDGSAQATYNGWPLYYYVGDGKPGDTNGQGVGGIWFVVGTDGVLIRDAA